MATSGCETVEPKRAGITTCTVMGKHSRVKSQARRAMPLQKESVCFIHITGNLIQYAKSYMSEFANARQPHLFSTNYAS